MSAAQRLGPSHERSALDHLEGLNILWRAVDSSQKTHLRSFWRNVKRSLTDLETTIDRLRDSLALPQALPCPAMSASTNAIRDTLGQVIDLTAQLAEDATRTVQSICDIDPARARDFL
ncbi:hypothetical protein VTL71DRAFT_1204, partial [Oculimacula yallundae]